MFIYRMVPRTFCVKSVCSFTFLSVGISLNALMAIRPLTERRRLPNPRWAFRWIWECSPKTENTWAPVPTYLGAGLERSDEWVVRL